MNVPFGATPIVLRNHMSVKEAVRYSGYSVQYLRMLLRSGGLGGLKIGQLWLIEMKGIAILLGKARIVVVPNEYSANKLIEYKNKYELPFEKLFVLNLDGYGSSQYWKCRKLLLCI